MAAPIQTGRSRSNRESWETTDRPHPVGLHRQASAQGVPFRLVLDDLDVKAISVKRDRRRQARDAAADNQHPLDSRSVPKYTPGVLRPTSEADFVQVASL
jgi:hypothetical protein